MSHAFTPLAFIKPQTSEFFSFKANYTNGQGPLFPSVLNRMCFITFSTSEWAGVGAVEVNILSIQTSIISLC